MKLYYELFITFSLKQKNYNVTISSASFERKCCEYVFSGTTSVGIDYNSKRLDTPELVSSFIKIKPEVSLFKKRYDNNNINTSGGVAVVFSTPHQERITIGVKNCMFCGEPFEVECRGVNKRNVDTGLLIMEPIQEDLLSGVATDEKYNVIFNVIGRLMMEFLTNSSLIQNNNPEFPQTPLLPSADSDTNSESRDMLMRRLGSEREKMREERLRMLNIKSGDMGPY